jgi:hypothetical protein
MGDKKNACFLKWVVKRTHVFEMGSKRTHVFEMGSKKNACF